MTTNTNSEKNYASLATKLVVIGGVIATVAGLGAAQNLTLVSASKNSEYISVSEVAAGDSYATILATNGKAYSRGWNNVGQLGVQTGSKVNVADWTEINLPEKLVDVEASDHTVALGESGKLYTWGANQNGQVGDGTNASVFVPTQITAVDRYSKIASGDSFTLGLDSEGRLWSWGANNAGQLGDGTTTDRSNPTMVGGDTTFAEIYAAKDSAYAIATDGTLWAWGSNNAGQLGDGTTDSKNKPTAIQTSQKWNRLAVNIENNTVLAIDRNGYLYSWGANNNGLLGNGTDWRKLQKEEDARFQAMIDQIKADDQRRKQTAIDKCVDEAFKTAYEAYKVEYDKVSKERDSALKSIEDQKNVPTASPSPSASAAPTATPAPTATAVPTATAAPTASPSPSPSATISVPNPDDIKVPSRKDFVDDCTKKVEATFAATDTSGMKAGVIKEPALNESLKKPALVTNAFTVKDIAMGSENAFAVDSRNRLYSWGKDANGQTGLNLEDANSLTQVPVLVRDGVADVDAGEKYGVAVGTNGDLLVWGVNNSGTLMSDPKAEGKLLQPTVKGDGGYTAVTAGVTTVYGFKNQTAYSWGNNQNGELGIGAAEGVRYSPVELGRKLSAIAPGAKGAVALGTANQLMYWGVNGSGQFGNSKTSNDAERQVSSNEISTFTAIAAGDKFTTALSADGRVWGWGSNANNLLDLTGSTKDKVTPTVVSTGLAKVTAMAAGKHVAAFTDGGSVVVWANRESLSYNIHDIVELAAGDDHVVARNKDGKVWNWSLNTTGVREGTEAKSFVSVDDRTYASIAAGGQTSGAVTDKGEAVIWGSDNLRLSGSDGSPVENFEFKKLSIGNTYVLGIDKNKVLWGWGENSYRVLGSLSVSKVPTVLTAQNNDNAKEGK